MKGLWVVFPSWFYAVAATYFGRWGEAHWLRRPHDAQGAPVSIRGDWGIILITNLVFLSLVPVSLLSVIGVLLPFGGARAGLSLGLVAFLFGCVPARLMDVEHHGWDRTLWAILIDLLRLGGALMIIGWLVM